MAYDGAQKPSEIAAVLNAVRVAFRDDWRCFQATRVLGSMLVFDFGRRTSVATRDGGKVDVGSGTLSVGNVYWWVGGFQRRINSEVLDDASMADLRERFVGRDLIAVEGSAKALRLALSGGVSLNLDMTNAWDQPDDDEICVLSANGVSATVFPNRRVELRSDQTARRAA